ncbi:MAG: hypothetical protein R6W82_01560 [bacterium]
MTMSPRVCAVLPLALTLSLIMLTSCDESTGPAGGDVPGFVLEAEVAVGENPRAVTAAGDHYVVANRYQSLMLIDAATLTVTDTLDPAGFFPTEIRYHAASQTLVVTDDASGQVRWVDLPALTMTDTRTIPAIHDPFFSNPAGLDYDADNDRFYALETRGGTIAVIPRSPGPVDTVRYRPQAEGSYSIEVGLATAVDEALDRLFLTSRNESKLFVYETSGMTKLDSLTAEDGVLGINSLLTDAANGHLVLSNQQAVAVGGGRYEGTLDIYDGATLEYLMGVPVPDYPEEGGMTWVTEGSSMAVVSGTWLIEFSTPDYQRLHAMDLESEGTRVAYDPVRSRFLVTFEDEDVVRVYTRAQAVSSY